jgi:potassium-dependent mechanosensitive channel
LTIRRLLFCMLIVLLLPRAARAEDVPTTAEQIQQAQAQERERTDLDEAVQQQIIAHYDEALRWQQLAQQWREQASQFEQQREAAAGEREQVQRDLAQPVETRINVPEDATLDALRHLRDQAEADLNAARERLVQLQRERDHRAIRRAEIPAELAGARSDLEELRQQLEAIPAADQPNALRRARQAELRAHERKLDAKIDALTKEIANYDARTELLPLRVERANRRVLAREAQLREWQGIVDQRARAEAAEQAQAARRAAAEAHPALRSIAEEIVDLVDRRSTVEGKITAQRGYAWIRERAESRLFDTMAMYERDRQRIETATRTGLTDIRLRSQREELVELRRRIDQWHRQLQTDLATTQRERVDLEFERRQLPSLTEARNALLQAIDQQDDLDDAQRLDMAVEVDRLLAEHRTQFDELIETYATLERYLLDIEQYLTPLTRLVQEYQRVIDERILWIRSMDPIGAGDATAAWRELGGLFTPASWGDLLSEQWQQIREHPFVPALAVLIFSAWYIRRTRRTKRMRELAEQVRSYRTDNFQHTAEAALYTIINSLFWPALMWVIAWQLARPTEPSDLAMQVSAGLNRTAWILLLFTFMLQFARNSGLAKAHFRWRDDTRNMLRWNLRWLGCIVLPLSFIMAASEWEMLRSGLDPLGRFAFIAAMIVLTIFVVIVLRPHKGVLKHMVEESHSPWVERLSYFWYFAAIVIPLALAGLAAGGYFYTALQLEDHLVGTFALIIALILINGLVLRWLFIAQRQMTVAEAKRKREEALQQQREALEKSDDGDAAATSGTPTGQAVGAEGGTVIIDEAKIDLQSVNEQTQRILRTAIVSIFIIGVWLIWSNMLPAVSMLDRVEVWPSFGNIRDTAVAPPPVETLVGREWVEHIPQPFAEPQRPFDAADLPQPESVEGVVTLTNVLVFILIAIVAFLVGRNIPGLLEIAILQRLPLQESVRYAIVTLTRYAIIVIGTILAFGAIGIGWSQVQWIVAAITLGIGFGLQEIVANFISGIIILFEQPIRVGDTVTVNNISGTVTKIRMRATTIVDWDRKELIIPNKTFITGDVINWTLNDPILRVVIPVGIAYGSDTVKAEQTLLRVADEHPIVLKDPPPSVVFSEFGDSSLNFNLRVFIPHISELVKVRHEMHRAIDQAFREANIEIAFPQRDIHVRTIKSALSLRQEEPPKKLPAESRSDGKAE